MKLTPEQVQSLLRQMSIITLMVEFDLKAKDAELLYEYPDIQLSKGVEVTEPH